VTASSEMPEKKAGEVLWKWVCGMLQSN